MDRLTIKTDDGQWCVVLPASRGHEPPSGNTWVHVNGKLVRALVSPEIDRIAKLEDMEQRMRERND